MLPKCAWAVVVGRCWTSDVLTSLPPLSLCRCVAVQIVINGQHIGADICGDHNSVTSVSTTMSAGARNDEPLAIQLVVSTGQTIDLNFVKVRVGGYAVLCDGASGLAGGQVKLVDAVNAATTTNPVPSASSTKDVDLTFYSTAAAMAADHGTLVVRVPWAWKQFNAKDQTGWESLYDPTEAWALVSDRLDL
jgi:hypothetical protein